VRFGFMQVEVATPEILTKKLLKRTASYRESLLSVK